jgi:hypothetical protein
MENGDRRFCKKILDVAGVSVEPGRYMNFTPQSTVVHDMPFPNASDHQPISLMFKESGRTRPARERGAPRIPFVPEWLLEDADFLADLAPRVDSWKVSRPEGLAGIESFNHLLVGTAGAFLATKHVLAKTAQHQFDIVAALLSTMQANDGYVPAKRLQKWLAADRTVGRFRRGHQRCSRVAGTRGGCGAGVTTTTP